ncbi:MAG: hypothetical protein J6X18_06555, partial [Bacteroidales bacterium]|nr:hypothetical protein [Bacteroidales bacterium]
MKKTYRFTDDEFQKILREAVSKVVKRSLNEDFDDFDAHDTDDSDDYEDELLKSMDRSNRKALGIDDKQSSGDFFRDVLSLGSKNGSTSQKGGDVDFDDEIWGKESTDDFESETEENGLENNELYVKALEDLEND